MFPSIPADTKKLHKDVGLQAYKLLFEFFSMHFDTFKDYYNTVWEKCNQAFLLENAKLDLARISSTKDDPLLLFPQFKRLSSLSESLDDCNLNEYEDSPGLGNKDIKKFPKLATIQNLQSNSELSENELELASFCRGRSTIFSILEDTDEFATGGQIETNVPSLNLAEGASKNPFWNLHDFLTATLDDLNLLFADIEKVWGKYIEML